MDSSSCDEYYYNVVNNLVGTIDNTEDSIDIRIGLDGRYTVDRDWNDWG